MLLNLFLDAAGVREKKKKKMPELFSSGEIVTIYIVGFFPKGSGRRESDEGRFVFLPSLFEILLPT